MRAADRLSKLEQQVSALQARIDAYLDERSELMSAHISLIVAFQKLQDQYSEGLHRARQTIDDLQKVQADQEPKFSSEPLYFSEEEEDLEARFMSGQIEPGAYKEALRALEEAGAVAKIEVD